MLRQVVRAAHVSIWDGWDDPLEVGTFYRAKDGVAHFGLAPAQVEAGTRWDDNVYPTDRIKLHAYLQRAESARARRFVDYRLIVGEGELLWVRHWTLSRITHKNHRPWIRNMMMPIPEQKHLEWECLRVSERECNRVGQELHDDLCQVLAGLTFMMRAVEQRARRVNTALADEVDELNSHLVGATERVRSMAHGLFPAQLNYASLRDALQAYANEARTLFRIHVTLEIAAKLPRHTPEQIIQVYRIIQEAVSNAVRHGHATSVKLIVLKRRLGLELRVEDNGSGFPSASARPEGIGVHVMQYRAHVLGGVLDFLNLSPRGVAARLVYPIAQTTNGQTSKTIATP